MMARELGRLTDLVKTQNTEMEGNYCPFIELAYDDYDEV